MKRCGPLQFSTVKISTTAKLLKCSLKLRRILPKLVFIILYCILASTFILFLHRSSKSKKNLTNTRKDEISSPWCKLPSLPLDDPGIMKYMKYEPPIQCTMEDGSLHEDWVTSNGSHAFLTEAAKAKYGQKIICYFNDIYRIDDQTSSVSWSTVKTHVFQFKDSDFVRVFCKSETPEGGRQNWTSFLTGVHSTLPSRKAVKQSSRNVTKLNVIIWGHDSMSSKMFQRKLPLTFKYLDKELGGVLLKGHNIVGDGTPYALISMFTGQTEAELPEVRKEEESAHWVNVYPFVWKQFQLHGYLTGYLEDCTTFSTFSNRLKGFLEQPVDFYMRSFFEKARVQNESSVSKWCIGGLPRHKIMTNYLKSIVRFRRGVPKFVFCFHGELSHGHVNAVQGSDVDSEAFFRDLKENGDLENTILIAMSDHGARFTELRETMQGKLEERLPFFMFVFPEWFKSKFKVAYQNFLANSELLTTPFDIHATLEDILRISTEEVSDEYFQQPNDKGFRQMSLFRPISPDRTCQDAHIAQHWCSCLDWHDLNVESTTVKKAGESVVHFINTLLHRRTKLCANLTVNRIIWAGSLRPSDQLIRFKESLDPDGLVPDFAEIIDITADTKNSIQLQLETLPGFGLFEVTLIHSVANDTFQLNLRTMMWNNLQLLAGVGHQQNKQIWIPNRVPIARFWTPTTILLLLRHQRDHRVKLTIG